MTPWPSTARRIIEARLEGFAKTHGLTLAEGDLLFTLRRVGKPYRMLPSHLSTALLVSSGTMTARLDRLEARALIRRLASPDNRRTVIVELTEHGLEVVEEAVTQHVAAEQAMLEPLSDRDRATLDRILSRLIEHLAS